MFIINMQFNLVVDFCLLTFISFSIPKPVVQQPMPTGLKIKTEPHPIQSVQNIVTSSPVIPTPTQPPPLSVSQASTQLQHPQAQITTQPPHLTHHQVYQQMLAQVYYFKKIY